MSFGPARTLAKSLGMTKGYPLSAHHPQLSLCNLSFKRETSKAAKWSILSTNSGFLDAFPNSRLFTMRLRVIPPKKHLPSGTQLV